MKYDELIDHYKTPAAAAAAINTDRQRVHGWKNLDRIPTDAQIQYEVATAGALRADLPAEIRKPLRVA